MVRGKAARAAAILLQMKWSGLRHDQVKGRCIKVEVENDSIHEVSSLTIDGDANASRR
jgi:hypothetical protein